jgi:hypothetical protein
VAHVDQAKFWNRCPHNGESSADFLIWHRAYTYYFERILREASGDPSLSIPYWDYTGDERVFPKLFSDPEQDPQTEEPTNPLYDQNRELVFMVGLYELADRVVTTDIIFAEKNFFGETEDTGFAGGVGDSERGTQGLIERQPHNLMHVVIGGVIGDTSGAMAEVATAAHDPIFWVHHTNIDRLWAKWETLEDRSWGSVPSLSWFHERPWHFYDVDGTVKNEPRHHYMRYRTIGTTYDDDVAAAKRLSDRLPIDGIRPKILLTEAGLVSPMTDGQKLSPTANTVIPLTRPEGADVAAVGQLRAEEKAKKPKLLLELTFTPLSLPR